MTPSMFDPSLVAGRVELAGRKLLCATPLVLRLWIVKSSNSSSEESSDSIASISSISSLILASLTLQARSPPSPDLASKADRYGVSGEDLKGRDGEEQEVSRVGVATVEVFGASEDAPIALDFGVKDSLGNGRTDQMSGCTSPALITPRGTPDSGVISLFCSALTSSPLASIATSWLANCRV